MTTSEIVDHLEHPTAILIRSLLEKEGRRTLNQMIIDDEENIAQALTAGITLKMVLVTDEHQLSDSCRIALHNVPVITLSKRTGKKLFGGEKISRVFAIADIPQMPTLSALSSLKNDLIVLDNLSLSGNIGAIIRTSMAFQVGAIILLDTDPIDIYDRRVIRASRGYVFRIPMLSTDTATLIKFFKTQAIKILTTTSHASAVTIEHAITNPDRLAIIFGGEKAGCTQTLFDAADIKARIPTQPEVESLNVSVAAGIILYLRQQNRALSLS